MPSDTLEYRLRIRNRDDDADLLILSSRATDPNCLLTEPPQSDGQRVDPIVGRQEIGVVVWRAVDRDDGGDTRTITAAIADAFARNQMLSNRCVGEYSKNSGAWTVFHTGYLNSQRLEDALRFGFTVGDTDRREQSAELFKALTPTFSRGSYILGGPIAAPSGPIAFGATPVYAFAGVKDYGPVRMQKVAATAGANTIAFELVSGYIRPYFDRLRSTVGADEVQTINRLARPWAVSAFDTRYTAPLGVRRAWMDFPGLVVRLRRVSDGQITEVKPVAKPTVSTAGEIDELVNGEHMGLYVHWPAIFVVPANGTQYDVWVFPTEVSENAPLHWAGNPVDLITQAWDQEAIPYDATAAAAVRSVLADLWVELRFTEAWQLKDLMERVAAPFGFAARLNADGEQVLFATRITPPASVDTVTVAEIVTDE